MAKRLPCGIGGPVGISESSVPIAPAQFSTLAKRNTSAECGVTGTPNRDSRRGVVDIITIATAAVLLWVAVSH